MGPRQGVGSPPLASEIPKGGAKLTLSEVKKKKPINSNWIEFQTVSRPHHFRAHSEKNANFATMVRYPGSHSGYVHEGSKNLPNGPTHTRSLLQRILVGQMFGCWFTFLCEFEAFLYCHSEGYY